MTKLLFPIFIILSINSCKSFLVDKYVNSERSEVVSAMTKDNKNTQALKVAPIPKISNMISLPRPPKFLEGSKIISFSVTDNIDLKDVLIELGRVVNLDIDIDPEISGGVIMNAKNRPLIEVIQRISSIGNLVYSFENGTLIFKKDSPYSKHHPVNFLIEGPLWDDVVQNLNSILSNSSSEDSSTSINKSAGIITVFADSKGQEAADIYLDEVQRNSSAQVLIEAKVVEVTLNDEFSAGINWEFLDGGGGDIGTQNGVNIKNTASSISDTNPLSISALGSGVLSGDIKFDISALETFGTVRAISSPRISALNNTKAKLDFVDKLIYFTIETETNTLGSGSGAGNLQTIVNATKNEEDIGVELEITPSINKATNEITLEVKPKLSIKNGDALDPSRDAQGVGLENKIPIIQTREIKTTMKINSGDTLVIGGLMKENATNTDTGIPFLGRIPLLGYLFKYVSRTTEIVETVIFVKATIIDNNNSINKYDRDFHNNFIPGKRPYF